MQSMLRILKNVRCSLLYRRCGDRQSKVQSPPRKVGSVRAILKVAVLALLLISPVSGELLKSGGNRGLV
jgi:hypothetical protein